MNLTHEKWKINDFPLFKWLNCKIWLEIKNLIHIVTRTLKIRDSLEWVYEIIQLAFSETRKKIYENLTNDIVSNETNVAHKVFFDIRIFLIISNNFLKMGYVACGFRTFVHSSTSNLRFPKIKSRFVFRCEMVSNIF